MAQKDRIKILVLAAGYGKRMQSELPKVLIPLFGKPLVAHALEAVRKSGLDERPTVVIGQQREAVKGTLGDGYIYIVQEKQLGTGHAVMATEAALKNKADHILVLYGDHPFIRPETIQKLVKKHLDSGNKITMATVKLPDFKEWRVIFYKNFSRIIRDSSGNIVKDVQFKDANDEEKKVTEVNPCYFCFEAKWLWEKLKTLQTNNAQKEYHLTDLVQTAIREKAKIATVEIEPREALGVNSKEELSTLESLRI